MFMSLSDLHDQRVYAEIIGKETKQKIQVALLALKKREFVQEELLDPLDLYGPLRSLLIKDGFITPSKAKSLTPSELALYFPEHTEVEITPNILKSLISVFN